MGRPGHAVYGLLSRLELAVLSLRSRGYSLSEAARALGMSRSGVWAAERRARRAVELAMRTLMAYHAAVARAAVYVRPGVPVAELPGIIISEADRADVKLAYDYTGLFELVRSEAKLCGGGDRVAKPMLVLVTGDGRVHVYCEGVDEAILELVENLRVVG